jgi:hypothetical protein
MLVLSYGITKSGSTLAFELCKVVLEQSGFEQRRLPDAVTVPGRRINFLEFATIDNLERLMVEIGPEEIIAVKTHDSLRPTERQFLQEASVSNRVRIQVNYRDPREIALSLVDAGAKARAKGEKSFSEYFAVEDTVKDVSNQLKQCRLWGSLAGALRLFYNDVAFNTPDAIAHICDHLGISPLDESAVAEVVTRVSKTFTQKNRAAKDRYKDLTIRQSEFLIEAIKGSRPFINRVCMRRDMSWFENAFPVEQ